MNVNHRRETIRKPSMPPLRTPGERGYIRQQVSALSRTARVGQGKADSGRSVFSGYGVADRRTGAHAIERTLPLDPTISCQSESSMTVSAEDREALADLDARLRTVLPEEYQDSYESVQPVSMGSAPLKVMEMR